MPPPRQAVVDVQAFLIPLTGEYVFKEFSLIDLDTKREEHFLFKPPRNHRGRDPHDKFLENKHHGLRWNCGIHEYGKLGPFLARIRSRYKHVFAKGHEKCRQLERAMGHPVYELEDFGCPGLKKLAFDRKTPLTCPNHTDPEKICARRQAVLLAEWCAANRAVIDLYDPDVRLRTFYSWPSYLNPGTLAREGFVKIRGSRLGVRCVYCGFTEDDLRGGVDPQKLHQEEEPECPTFQGQGKTLPSK